MKLHKWIFTTMLCLATIVPSTTAFAVTKKQSEEEVAEQIKIWAKEKSVPPINAKIDPVWKGLPGLNGLTVDVKKSVEKMKREGTIDEKLLQYKEVQPSVHLQDLPPTPIYRGLEEKKMVAFTVNVAWGNEYLLEMLKIFKKHHLHITFNLEGKWAKNNSELAKAIVDEGHEVGNHSYSHPNMAAISKEKIREELHQANEMIVAATGQKPLFFAPPSGNYNADVLREARNEGMNTILWSCDTIDWQRPLPSKILYRVNRKVHAGAIVLMHPTKPTTEALEEMIRIVEQRGWTVVTVSQLLSEERIENL